MSHKIAPNSLDFCSYQGITVVQQIGRTAWTARSINEAIKVCLSEIHARLSEPARIAKAAEACANAGSITEGVTVSMDIEQLIAGRLQNTASLLNRLSRG
jgi:hypothetical protein